MSVNQYQFLKVESKPNWTQITLNRPEVYNALNKNAKSELTEVLNQLSQQQPGPQAILITGEGKAFCSGQDLGGRNPAQKQGRYQLGETLRKEWNPLIEAIANNSKIVIAALNGVCAGAGVSLALACDLIVAHPKVRFVCGFTSVGLVCDAGSTFSLVRSLGRAKTQAWALLGDPLFAQDFMQAGLINAVEEDFLSTAQSWADRIAPLPPLAVAQSKVNFRYAQDHNYLDCLQQEVWSQQHLGASEDYREGVSAFLEKRSPQYKGR